MTASRRLQTAGGLAFVLLASVLTGCLDLHQGGGWCDDVMRPLRDGERIHGQAPVALLAQYLGRWRGTLTWRTGQTTGLDLEVTDDPSSPYMVHTCFGYREVSTTRPATIASDDGAVSASWPLTVSVDFYSYPSLFYNASSQVELTGDFTPPITDLVDLDRYDQFTVTLFLDWRMPPDGPSSGSVEFKGTLPGTGGNDRIELGTIAFFR